MSKMESKKMKDTRVVQTDQVLINDLNNYNSLFGGVLMKKWMPVPLYRQEGILALRNVLLLQPIQ